MEEITMEEITEIDYTSILEEIIMKLNNIENLLRFVITFLFVFMIVIVCKFAYRHFNMFFN